MTALEYAALTERIIIAETPRELKRSIASFGFSWFHSFFIYRF
jgi:hypothetical protein